MSGEEFAGNLKEIPVLSKIPIVIYNDIGARPDSGNQSKKETGFTWNAEGAEVLKRVCGLLGIK